MCKINGGEKKRKKRLENVNKDPHKSSSTSWNIIHKFAMWQRKYGKPQYSREYATKGPGSLYFYWMRLKSFQNTWFLNSLYFSFLNRMINPYLWISVGIYGWKVFFLTYSFHFIVLLSFFTKVATENKLVMCFKIIRIV